MKVIIAGGRNISDPSYITAAVRDSGWREQITEIVSGGCRGIDNLGEAYAIHRGWKLTVFPAEWNKHGKNAGPIRNLKMADYADALILIWDGKSKGSANMKRTMEELGKPIFEFIIPS